MHFVLVIRERRNSINKGDNWIDDDIYKRIIEFTAQNEVIKMNSNYSNVEKEYGQTNTFISIMLMTKITLDM